MSRRRSFSFSRCSSSHLRPARATIARPASSRPEVPAPQPSPPPMTEVLFKGLKARAIGPTIMGGRISDIAIDPRNPGVVLRRTATGGVFKTNDNGATFDPIFDKESALSIGAIAIAPSDPDVIYVGTGEANDRNSSGWGNGVYRSNDGGGTWENIGLKDTRAIGADHRASERSEYRLRRGLGSFVGRRRRARSFQNNRRRKKLETDFAGARSRSRAHRLQRCRIRSFESRNSFRGALCAATHAVEFHLRRGARPMAKMSAEFSKARTAARLGKN